MTSQTPHVLQCASASQGNDRPAQLTAVSKLPAKDGKRVRWLCQCTCGNTKVARANDLRSGNTKSCGCRRSVETSRRAREQIGSIAHG